MRKTPKVRAFFDFSNGKNGKNNGKNGKNFVRFKKTRIFFEKVLDNYSKKWYNDYIIGKEELKMKQLGRTPQPLTDEQREIAADYLDSDLSYKEISAKYGKPESTIIYWVKKLRKERENDKL